MAAQPPKGASWFIRNLANPRERQEAGSAALDAPALPGAVMKAVTLVAALENGAVDAGTTAMCRRAVTVDGVRYTCSHPDLKRPLSVAEALAHSCDSFFLGLAPRLTRDQLNRTRLAAGLPPLGAQAQLAPALIGLDGPRVTPRALIDVLARLAGVGPDPPVPMRPASKAILLEGLRGAALYGSAAALGERGLTALAKTGSTPTPGLGLVAFVVALVPALQPTHGLIVVAPGATASDAAAIAANVVAKAGVTTSTASPTTVSLSPPAPAPANTAGSVQPAVAGEQIRLGRTLADGRIRVENVPLDDYVAQVLAGEGQPTAGDAAQQALAITARTFAVANRGRHRREGFDLCDTTHCQVVRPSTAVTRRAAAATADRVLLHAGRPAPVFYSASCGGRVERASQVWPGAVDLSQPDRDDAHGAEAAWSSDVRATDVERALRVAGLRGSRLRSLRVVQRNQSGRVVRIQADGFSPPDISGNDFRLALGRVVGWQLVKSTAFDVRRTGTGYRFEGRGYGHGVGLCVVGAGARALRGESSEAILKFYFPSLAIGHVPVTPLQASVAGEGTTPNAAAGAAIPAAEGSAPAPSEAARGTTAAAGAVPEPAVRSDKPLPAAPNAAEPRRDKPAPIAATDVQIALPATGEARRADLIAIVRRARDEVAAATGQKAPAVLRLTIHPTVESFGRATGQPWWASASTTSTEIALPPIELLEQRGQLEHTVRHEVAHALLDAALTGRPMWVREGAAAFFSRASSEQGVPASSATARAAESASRLSSRLVCPTDAELLRPVSAGAQRDADARAEACFARQIGAGKKWTEIR